jgi:hypothetical protein
MQFQTHSKEIASLSVWVARGSMLPMGGSLAIGRSWFSAGARMAHWPVPQATLATQIHIQQSLFTATFSLER